MRKCSRGWSGAKYGGQNYNLTMTKKPKKKRSGKQPTERYLGELEKRGQLNPQHRRDFDRLLDDVVPPPTKKK
jgi:hypothetical protein